MMPQTHYVVRWVLKEREFYLLWADGGATSDRYALVKQGASNFLVASTRKQLEIIASKRHLLVSTQATKTIDFDYVNLALLDIRPTRHLSIERLEALLDAWNTFEDVARSTSVDLMQIAPHSRASMNTLYQKLFYGNNLPAVTPERKKYLPILIKEERRLLRLSFRSALQKLPTLLSSNQN
jgi:hypothetical protein